MARVAPRRDGARDLHFGKPPTTSLALTPCAQRYNSPESKTSPKARLTRRLTLSSRRRSLRQSIVDVSIIPETPRVGEAVTVTVTVRNDSPIAANIPVTLRFPSKDKQPEIRRPSRGTWYHGGRLLSPGARAIIRLAKRTFSVDGDQYAAVNALVHRGTACAGCQRWDCGYGY